MSATKNERLRHRSQRFPYRMAFHLLPLHTLVELKFEARLAWLEAVASGCRPAVCLGKGSLGQHRVRVGGGSRVGSTSIAFRRAASLASTTAEPNSRFHQDRRMASSPSIFWSTLITTRRLQSSSSSVGVCSVRGERCGSLCRTARNTSMPTTPVVWRSSERSVPYRRWIPRMKSRLSASSETSYPFEPRWRW